MTVVSSVDCCVMDLTPSETRAREGGNTASLTAKVAWSERYDFMADVIENRRAWPYDLTSSMLAKSCTCVPLAEAGIESGQVINYNFALITVNYDQSAVNAGEGSSESSGAPAYESPDPEEHEPPITDLMSESFEPSVEFLTLDPKFFAWGAANGSKLEPEEAPGMQQFGAVLVRTLYDVDVVPTKAVTNMGKVNDGNYSSQLLGVSFAPETLLYLPPSMNRTIRSDGANAWTLTLRFSYKHTEWNKFWRVSAQAWQSLYVKGGGIYRNYPTGNFSSLLF